MFDAEKAGDDFFSIDYLDVVSVFVRQHLRFAEFLHLGYEIEGILENGGLHFFVVGFAGVGANGHMRGGNARGTLLFGDGGQGRDDDGGNARGFNGALHDGGGTVAGAAAAGEQNHVHIGVFEDLGDGRAGFSLELVHVAAAAHKADEHRTGCR